MSRCTVLLLCACLLLTVHQGFATEASDVPLGLTDFGRSEANLEVLSTSPDFTSITLSQPNIVMEEEMFNYQTYNAFSIPGEPWVWQDGLPAVPQVTRFYRIPNTGSVDLVLTEEEYDLVEGINPFPIQSEVGSFGQLVRNSEVYTRDGWYPSNVVEMSAPLIMRDFRVVTVTMHPVQVNPVTQQVRIYRHLSANLIANHRPGENEILTHRRPSGAWARTYRDMIANLDEHALDDMTTVPGTYLILCKNGARAWADSLFTWKTRKGFRCVIDSRASWTAAQMITAIRTMYTNDPNLEYVCLVGDPQWTHGVPADGSNYDHTFGLGNAGDDLEDVAVGRLCGDDNGMPTINAKIMLYERTVNMTDTLWYHKGFFYAGVSHSVASNHTLMQWASQMFRTYTGVTNNTVDYHTGDDVNNQTIINQINGGVSVFLWRGGWIGGMDNTLAALTSPNNRLPITLTITCATGDYISGLGVSESWLTAGSPAEPRGGICGIGTATAGTHPPQNYTLAGGLIYNICNVNIEHIGTALSTGKYWLTKTWGAGSSEANNFSRYCNLMGDPGLSIWTDVPEVITATHPTVLNVGARQVAVQVLRVADNIPVADALVTLWKRGTDSTWVRGTTDDQGRVTLPVEVDSAGNMFLTVTKQNHKPYLFTIPCSQNAQYCQVNGYVLDDDNAGGTNGNADGILNPGETIDVAVNVKNFGNANTATGVSAVLTSLNPKVTVVNGTSSYADIPAGQSVAGQTPFRISAVAGLQDGESVLLGLAVTSSAGTTNGIIELRCVAGEVTYVSHQVSGGAFLPGTTVSLAVTVKNIGHMLMAGTSARLISLSPFVQVDEPNAVYGDILVNASVNNNSDLFTISSNSLTFRGHQATMMLITTEAAGHIDTTTFVLAVGNALSTDPTGPDAYGYFAYDNTDAGYEMVPTFQYVNISTGGLGTNLNLADVGEHTTPHTTPSTYWSTARRLPFAFKFYGMVYDTVTISSNGWIAFGNQAWNEAFRNFPIPAMVAPEAMIAPYWDDLKTSGSNLGVWMYNDTTNHRFIVQWKAGVGSSYGTNIDFEVILYDTTFHPTFDGNGLILCQYNTISMNLPSGDGGSDASGSSIGIQAPRSLVGLAYAYQNTYAPGAATVSNGRAILFTTNARMLFGALAGTVRDAETDQPMEGATVSIDGYNYYDVTDANGEYFIDNVLIGTYSVSASKADFNTSTTADVLIELDSIETVDFVLYHPEFALSTDSIFVETNQPIDTSFDIINDGNGSLDYRIEVFYAGDENPNPWDSVDNVNLSLLTNDYQIMGCEFVEDSWWISGGGGASGQNQFYIFDRNGVLVRTVPQPSTTPVGWFDLAYDGQYLYGSDSHDLQGVDMNGTVQVTIPSPMNPTRAVAYNPSNQHFWVTDYTQDIFEIDRLGNIIRQIPNAGSTELSITGLAWNAQDPDGYYLYIFSQDGINTLTRVTRLNPVSLLRETVVDITGMSGDRAGGCTITGGWNSTLLVFGGIMQNAAGDRLQIHEMTFNTTWISIAPAQFAVPGGNTQTISVGLDPTNFIPNLYRVNLVITSEVLDSTITLPVTLAVPSAAPEVVPATLPSEYALHQNFPNPFNPATTIRYDLPHDGHVKLTVYNLLGETVADLVNQPQSAGRYDVRFDASTLPSGMYFYRLESGSFSKSVKMILMK